MLALSSDAQGGGKLEPLAAFMSNPAGAAIVDTVGPIRHVVQGSGAEPRRYLVIASGTATQPGQVIQVQVLRRGSASME